MLLDSDDMQRSTFLTWKYKKIKIKNSWTWHKLWKNARRILLDHSLFASVGSIESKIRIFFRFSNLVPTPLFFLIFNKKELFFAPKCTIYLRVRVDSNVRANLCCKNHNRSTYICDRSYLHYTEWGTLILLMAEFAKLGHNSYLVNTRTEN